MIIAPRNIGDVGADDHAHGGDRADHARRGSPCTIRPPVYADQDRQQVGDHRADDAGAVVGAPAADLGDPSVGVLQAGKMPAASPPR